MTDGWRDISTAPRDGTEFLAYGSYVYPGDTAKTEYFSLVEYDASDPEYPWHWHDFEGYHPEGAFSHWKPLVPPETTP